jgi:thiamine-phosphate pyrophosphorylase
MTTKVTRVRQAFMHGLYAITPDMADTARLYELVEASLRGGARMVQYRNKTAGPALRASQAQALLGLCRKHGVPLIINDHIELCLNLDADGLHLGAMDIAVDINMDMPGGLAQARRRLGTDRILGVSCYNRFELAQQAKEQGADYVAFGACFVSATKPAAASAPLQLISRARDELDIPVVAIGGITRDNAPLAIKAGASSIAVIGALFSATNSSAGGAQSAAPDVEIAAREFSQLFTQKSS